MKAVNHNKRIQFQDKNGNNNYEKWRTQRTIIMLAGNLLSMLQYIRILFCEGLSRLEIANKFNYVRNCNLMQRLHPPNITFQCM